MFGLTLMLTCVEPGVSFDDFAESLPIHGVPQWKVSLSMRGGLEPGDL